MGTFRVHSHLTSTVLLEGYLRSYLKPHFPLCRPLSQFLAASSLSTTPTRHLCSRSQQRSKYSLEAHTCPHCIRISVYAGSDVIISCDSTWTLIFLCNTRYTAKQGRGRVKVRRACSYGTFIWEMSLAMAVVWQWNCGGSGSVVAIYPKEIGSRLRKRVTRLAD